MGAYRLRDDGYPFKKIMHGKKWVGRVIHHADGSYRGYINKIELSTATTCVGAFESAVAKHLGYDSVESLDDNNRQVRAVRKVRQQRGRAAAQAYMQATTFDERMAAIDNLLNVAGLTVK